LFGVPAELSWNKLVMNVLAFHQTPNRIQISSMKRKVESKAQCRSNLRPDQWTGTLTFLLRNYEITNEHVLLRKWLTIQKIHREIFFHEIFWRIISFGQTPNEYPNYELIINVVYKLSSFSY
jgi:hypothetical protein